MRQLTANVFIETGQRGSNHGLVTTSDGLVLIDGPFKPSDALRLKAEIERRGRLRYIINTEPHGDAWLVKIKLSSPSDLDQLLSAADYQAYSWPDGIAPAVSSLYFWIYALAGSTRRALTAPFRRPR